MNKMQEIVRAWLSFFRAVQKLNLTPKQVAEDLLQLGRSPMYLHNEHKQLKPIPTLAGIADDKAAFVAKKYKKNLVAMSRAAIGRTLMVNQVVDMDWKFGVTAGSSEMRMAGNTFLQLRLTVDKGGKREDVYLEVTLNQFFELAAELEKARNAMKYLV